MKRAIQISMFLLASTAVLPAAHALQQQKHKDITISACLAKGLPSDFCTRVGNEDYDVDANSFASLAAHAMPDTQTTPHCSAANGVSDWLRQLGGSMRVELSNLAISSTRDGVAQLAADLGGALHTVQDNCAHSGMPNPQHAYYSLSDDCLWTSLSPDIQSSAISCAQTETAKVFTTFMSQLAHSGMSPTRLASDLGSASLPPRGQICSFLLEADNWDGYDHRWNNTLVTPALQTQLAHAITVDDSSTGDVCGGNAARLNIATQLLVASPASTSLVRHWCVSLNTYCLGYY